MSGNRRGFAALELLIAIAVGALLVALVIPSLERYQRGRELRHSAQQLLGAVRLAQQQAVTRDEDVRLVYTAGPPGRYAIERLDGTGLHHAVLPTALTVTGSYVVTPLQFRPTGTPLAGGEFCLTEGTRWLRLDVSAGTGRAQLAEVSSCP